jgi:hypothetical protein
MEESAHGSRCGPGMYVSGQQPHGGHGDLERASALGYHVPDSPGDIVYRGALDKRLFPRIPPAVSDQQTISRYPGDIGFFQQ